ncbi:MAG TPA: mechanosensitive ion channel, partial [Myxococcota bacterium]|nr:mechanosensitive ion channel [Myxococcota bacterium]
MWTEAFIAWGLPSVGLLAWLLATVLLLPRLAPSLAGPTAPAGRRRLARAILLVVFLLGIWIWGSIVPLPEATHRWWVEDLQPWFWATLALVLFYALAFPLLGQLLSFVKSRASRTESSLDDVLLASARRPVHVLILLVGFVLWVDLVPAPALMQQRVGLVVEASVVVVVILFVDALLIELIERRRAKSRVLATAGTVLRSMARAILFVIGLLMVLGTMGIDVTPVIASLGVGSLAIGLAMQSTLEDFIAGLLIAADQPVSMGDFIEIGDEKLSGTIDHIGWRSTRILTLQRT